MRDCFQPCQTMEPSVGGGCETSSNMLQRIKTRENGLWHCLPTIESLESKYFCKSFFPFTHQPQEECSLRSLVKVDKRVKWYKHHARLYPLIFLRSLWVETAALMILTVPSCLQFFVFFSRKALPWAQILYYVTFKSRLLKLLMLKY